VCTSLDHQCHWVYCAYQQLCLCKYSDFGIEDKLLGYAERAGASSLQGSIPGVWGKLQKLWYL
jgi:hypothetical protein